MNRNVIAFRILLSFYGLGLIAWPFMSFGAIFVFDDPNANPLFALYIAFSIWLYPLYFYLGFRWGHHAKNKTLLAIITKTSVPLLSAMFFIGIPVMGSVAIGFVTSESIADARERIERLEEKLDPIYGDRIRFIESRDPKQDAEKAFEIREIAFLPSSPISRTYPGAADLRMTTTEAEENYQIILESEFLSAIENGLGIDQSHNFPEDGYYSLTFRKYGGVESEYRRSFNATMYRLVQIN